MGNFYTNIILSGPDQEETAGVLRQMGRTAYISPAIEGFTVVYDRECENQDETVLRTLTSQLSRRLNCPALAVLNHDDDVLMYWLFEQGRLVDEYNSTPGYFEDTDDFDDDETVEPEGGDAEILCRVLDMLDAVEDVEDILSAPWDDERYVFAVVRHGDLVDALGLPTFCVGAGYTYIDLGEPLDGLEREELVHVTP